MEKKKSIQLSQAFGAVLTLVLVAVLIIVAIVIFVELASSFSATTSVTVVNETEAWLNQTAYVTSAETQCNRNTLVLVEAFNGSDNGALGNYNISIPAANITINETDFTFISADFLYNSSNVSYSYTYIWGSTACDASEDMVVEFGNYTSLIGLVGTIIFLGLVIGVLVTAFAFGGRKEV